MAFVSFRQKQGETYTSEMLVKCFREANPDCGYDEVCSEVQTLLKTHRLKYSGKWNMIHTASG